MSVFISQNAPHELPPRAPIQDARGLSEAGFAASTRLQRRSASLSFGGSMLLMRARRTILLVLSILLLALLLFPRKVTFVAKGPLRPQDLQAIRQKVAAARWRTLSSSVTHGQFGLLWAQLHEIATFRLVSVQSDDGRLAVAEFEGRSWAGSRYVLTNSLGTWFVRESERVGPVTR